jgi:hypothetical protein
MDNGYTDNETSTFDGQNYEIWSLRMKVFLQEHGYDVWYSVVRGYTPSKKPSKTVTKKELKRNNKIAMDFILEGLSDSVKEKVRQCSLAKEIWDKLHNLYSKGSHLIMEPIHQDKQDIDIEQEELDNYEEYYEEGIVNLEEKLISTLSDLKGERKKNKFLEKELIKLKEGSQNDTKNSEEVQQIIINIKVQLEEAKVVEETLKNQLK